MTDRIQKLTELTLSGKMYVDVVKTAFDETDSLLSRQERESKQLSEFILNQEPKITEYSAFTGFMNFDGSVVGEGFHRRGHRYAMALQNLFYCKPIDNLSTMDWQHATADYAKVLKKGINGIIEEINESLTIDRSKKETEFLLAMKRVAGALVLWARKCSERALAFSKTVENEEYKQNLEVLSAALLRVPENAPQSFYEAVLSIYLCFAADPDSLGTLDRYLYPFYKKDLENGFLTREKAGEYLQELFLMLQAATSVKSPNFTRGGESHFCIGGYLPNGEDCFSDLSALIAESLIELPTWIPQITLRWTKKTPREAFRFMMDCERRDPHKRIAFQNDEKRIKCYTEICGIPFEKAVGYTTVGCNEPAFLGAVTGGTSVVNFLRCTETVFHRKGHLIENAGSFDEFFAVFRQELFSDLAAACHYDNFYNKERAADINYLSSIFFNGCIEKAKSMTEGGSAVAVASFFGAGLVNAIDSLCIVKQFVFEEKHFTMKELISALKNDWRGYEEMRCLILKKGKFFGNDDELSNGVAELFYRELYEFLKDKTNLFGYHFLVGDLIGYRPHHRIFGERTKATPDGRYAGDNLKFGLSQSEGKDREGLSALLNSIAKADKTGIGCGSTVTNITIDEQLIKKDDNFEKTVDLFLAYFQNGGVHFQLNYLSREELLKAQATPAEYKNLRVRVSGFSDYFVKLDRDMQDNVISRTEKK